MQDPQMQRNAHAELAPVSPAKGATGPGGMLAMPALDDPASPLRLALLAMLLAFVYTILSTPAAYTSRPDTLAAIIWPAPAMAAALLWNLPYRRWPVLLLAVFLSMMLVGDADPLSVGADAAFALLNVFEVALYAFLGRRLVCEKGDIDSTRKLARFVFLLPLLATSVVAALGATIGALTKHTDWLEEWRVMLVGNGLAVLVLLPALLAWCSRQARAAAAPGDALPFVRSELARAGAAQRPTLLVKSRFAAADVAGAIAQLAGEGAAVIAGDVIADAAWWRRLRASAAGAIDAAHKARPEQVGLRLVDLRAAVEKESAGAPVFDALVADLCAGPGEFVRANDRIRRAAHRPALPPRLQPAGDRIRAALAAKPWDPPARKDLAPDATSQQALRFLLETGEAVDVGPELVLSADAYAKAAEAIARSIREEGPATVSELKQVLGATRRVMVPLCEKLDRDGITMRQGDERVLKTKV
jgi:hypothetical protein